MTYTQPLLLTFLIVGLISWLRVRGQRGAGLVAMSLLGFLAISWPPADWLLSRHLEVWYAVRAVNLGSVDAIVVLSAGLRLPVETRPYALPDQETYERCDYAAWLHHRWPKLPVLACGGLGPDGTGPYSAVMRDLLVKFGVPEETIWTEQSSRSTYENALYGAEILRKHNVRTIALVVDVRSMLRAEACFRKQGLLVLPVPVFRKERELGDEFMPRANAIARSELTLHESLGLIWYRLHGWI